jgi:hypothetical protein
LPGERISPKKGLFSHMEYTKNLKEAHAILDLLKYIILFYEIESISSLSQEQSISRAQAIGELTKKNGLSKDILKEMANKGRVYDIEKFSFRLVLVTWPFSVITHIC